MFNEVGARHFRFKKKKNVCNDFSTYNKTNFRLNLSDACQIEKDR
jgi:hypothetical protein